MTTAKTVDQLISAAIRSAANSTKAIQIAAVAVLMHAEKHGDYSKANKLVEGIRTSHRGDSLVAWFVKFGGFTVSEESESGFDGWSGAEHIRSNFEDAKKTGWETVKKAADPFTFDLNKKLHALLKSAEAAQKRAEKKPELRNVVAIDAARMQALRQMLAA